jgi:hypothetical protein
MVDSDDMLMTYTADVIGTKDNKSFSGRYWNTSLRHLSGGKWLTVYHGEVKAKSRSLAPRMSAMGGKRTLELSP